MAANLSVGTSMVYRTKRRFVEEALLIAVACSDPPSGRSRWTLGLLAGELVRRTEHTALSRETVRGRLAEQKVKPWQPRMWCIPVGSEYVARMEDILELYTSKPSLNRPVVCFDETPVQLIG